MLTLIEIIQRAEIFLKQRGISRPRREAEEVLADVLGVKRLDLYLRYEEPLAEKELQSLRMAIQRRSKREPTAYIAGRVDFFGLTLNVGPDVLIPRPETEILVDKMSKILENQSIDNKVLWDICCGSGCIGLSLKKRFPSLQVTLSDINEAALSLARSNAKGLDVTFKQGDLLHPFSGMQCDFFMCNPPYISEKEYLELEPEVKEWEPKIALVAGESGFEFYERIATALPLYLKKGGFALLEIGATQGVLCKKIFESQGWSCRIDQDWSGKDRYLFAQL